MDRRTFLLALGASMTAVAAGCSGNPSPSETMSKLENVTELGAYADQQTGITDNQKVIRGIDREAGVVVYIGNEFRGGSGGLAVVPLSATDLE